MAKVSDNQMFKLLFITFFVLLSTCEAFACSCGYPRIPVLDDLDTSDLVVVAKLERIEPPRKNRYSESVTEYVMETRMVIERVFKGNIRQGEAIYFSSHEYGYGCSETFEGGDIGDRWLVYVNEVKPDNKHIREALDRGLRVNYLPESCGRSRPVERAVEDFAFLNNIGRYAGLTRISEIFSHERKPLSNVRVVLTRHGETYESRSNEDGLFEFYGIPPGLYRVTITAPPGLRVLQRDTGVPGIFVRVEPKRHAVLGVRFVPVKSRKARKMSY